MKWALLQVLPHTFSWVFELKWCCNGTEECDSSTWRSVLLRAETGKAWNWEETGLEAGSLECKSTLMIIKPIVFMERHIGPDKSIINTGNELREGHRTLARPMGREKHCQERWSLTQYFYQRLKGGGYLSTVTAETARDTVDMAPFSAQRQQIQKLVSMCIYIYLYICICTHWLTVPQVYFVVQNCRGQEHMTEVP